MASIFQKNKLSFTEFPKPSLKDWENKITADLKGVDYKTKFNWQTLEGISHLPFYSDEKHSGFVSQSENSISNEWDICQKISIDDCSSANTFAKQALVNGASSLYFDLSYSTISSLSDLEVLLDGIMLEILTIHFSSSISSQKHLSLFEEYIEKNKLSPQTYSFKFNSDPFADGLATGKLLSKSDLSTNTIFDSFCINAKFYGDAGATMVDQLAFALATGNEYLGLGDSPEQTAKSIHFNFAVSSDYFLEMSKLRAFRLLWSQILDAYKSGLSIEHPAYIHAETSQINFSLKDPHNNILRTTTEAMAAAIGGANTITVTPFDELYNEENSFSDRVARNIQLILKEEAYFDKVADPGSGSYYIEHLTNQLAEKAWSVFQEIERLGGFHEAIKQDWVQKRVKDAQKARIEASKNGDLVLIGVNKYPLKNEEIRTPRPKTEDETPNSKNSESIETISTLRIAEAFEMEAQS